MEILFLSNLNSFFQDICYTKLSECKISSFWIEFVIIMLGRFLEKCYQLDFPKVRNLQYFLSLLVWDISCQKTLWQNQISAGWFIVLNDQFGPEMSISNTTYQSKNLIRKTNEHNSVGRSENCTGYTWEMKRPFEVVFFKCLTLIVIEKYINKVR